MNKGQQSVEVQHVNDHSFIISGMTVCIEALDAALADLHLYYHFDPTIMALSPDDAEALLQELIVAYPKPHQEDTLKFLKAKLGAYQNPTTRTLIHPVILQQLPQGTVKFWGPSKE